MAKLTPIHPSMVKSRSAFMAGQRPHDMDRMAVTASDRQMLESIALAIFTDMANAGCTLQETLASIYISGLQHAASAAAPPKRRRAKQPQRSQNE